MTHIHARLGLRESWETYRNRLSGHGLRAVQLRDLWRREGHRLLGWAGPGTPCRTSNGITVDESPLDVAEGEARPAAL